ncbi:MAG: AAA family ATPase [Desulfobacteraceae bacterium]|nr:AAA family ATPase [Desulfobacteraceae bacterium]
MNNKQNPTKKVKPLPIGVSDFKELHENKCYYIDKTLFIKEITGAWGKVLLIPRPRRFGKTLNLSMLRYFYEKSDEDRGKLFDGLAVRKDEIFEIHQGKYPVIFLTLKDIKGNSWKDLYDGLCRIISREVERHKEILEWDGIPSTALSHLESLVNSSASKRDYEDSLLILSEQLRRYHNQRVVILIDEYDTPLHVGYLKGFYDDVTNFMRNFLSGGLKDNENLFKGVVTGILRVAKESIFSGLNNLDVFTLLDDEFSAAFGFTEQETQSLLKDYGIPDRYGEVSHWYNGYLFGTQVVYNPWSLLSYVNRKNAKPRAYWINTASTELIDDLATRGGKELREELGQLLEGRSITKPVYDSIVMRDMENRDDFLWSFMLFSGYLKVTEQTDYEKYRLKIPNQEVHIAYRSLVRNWFAEKVESNQLEEMLMALETGDVKLFEQLLRKVVLQIMSYHDFSGVPEKVYHALVLGMFVWLSDKYKIRSNRESGYGRYDLMLKPEDDSKQGIVIEFKKVYENETPDEVLEAALKQIEDRKYAAEFEASGITDILKLAIAFRGKELWIKQG